MPTPDTHQTRLLRKLRLELGPEVLGALEDPEVVEILLNPDSSLWIEKRGEMTRIGAMTPVNAKHLLGTIAASLDTTINREQPLLEGELLLDGSRVAGSLPPITTNPTFAIRKKASAVFSLDQYVARGAMNADQRETLQAALKARSNILVAGGTSSGKTTLANAVIHGISELCRQDRLIVIEDTAEIQCQAENALLLRANSTVDLLRLLRLSLRYRPDRILVGEVRGPEALALLKAWNTGHPGGVATVHANSAAAALVRLEQLVAEAGPTEAQALIGEAVDLVVFMDKYRGVRRVREIIEVRGWEPAGYVINRRSELCL